MTESKKRSVTEIQNTPRELDNFLKEYLKYTENMEAPKPFHIWAAMSAIAGALGGKCYIDMGKFKYKPNMFIVFVAPPGVISKSTTADVGMRLLKKNPGIHFGPSSCTWQALFEKFIDVEQTYQVGKTKQKQSNLNLSVSELGTFLDFDNSEMVDTIVDLWDAKEGQTSRSTIGGGDKVINNAWLNLIGCTTPSWIQKNVPEYAIGGGFVSRTIFVYGDKKEKFIPYPNLVMDNKDETAVQQKLADELIRISALNGEFKLTDEAYKWGSEWYIDHNKNPSQHLKHLDGYAARKQAHMHKIAMCLSAAESNDKVINKKHLQLAEQMLQICEQDMMKVFEVTSDDREVKTLQLILRLLKRYPKGLTDTELRFKLASQVSGFYVGRAIEHAVAAGMINLVVVKDATVNPYRLSRKLREQLSDTASKKDLDLIRNFLSTGVEEDDGTES